MIYILSIAELSNRGLYLETFSFKSLISCHSKLIDYYEKFCKDLDMSGIEDWNIRKDQDFWKRIEIYNEGIQMFDYEINYTITTILDPLIQIE